MSSTTVLEIEEQLWEARRQVTILEQKLKEEIEKQQASCNHVFIMERDCDGHKTYRTYTCKHCRYSY